MVVNGKCGGQSLEEENGVFVCVYLFVCMCVWNMKNIVYNLVLCTKNIGLKQSRRHCAQFLPIYYSYT